LVRFKWTGQSKGRGENTMREWSMKCGK
jgi:hypothetical protein